MPGNYYAELHKTYADPRWVRISSFPESLLPVELLREMGQKMCHLL